MTFSSWAEVNTDQKVPVVKIIVLFLELLNVLLRFVVLIFAVFCAFLMFSCHAFQSLDLVQQVLRVALLLGQICIEAVQLLDDGLELF